MNVQAQQITSFRAGESTGVNAVGNKRVGNMFLAKQRHKHRQVNQRKNSPDVAPIMIMGNAQHLVKSALNVDYKATS